MGPASYPGHIAVPVSGAHSETRQWDSLPGTCHTNQSMGKDALPPRGSEQWGSGQGAQGQAVPEEDAVSQGLTGIRLQTSAWEGWQGGGTGNDWGNMGPVPQGSHPPLRLQSPQWETRKEV